MLPYTPGTGRTSLIIHFRCLCECLNILMFSNIGPVYILLFNLRVMDPITCIRVSGKHVCSWTTLQNISTMN